MVIFSECPYSKCQQTFVNGTFKKSTCWIGWTDAREKQWPSTLLNQDVFLLSLCVKSVVYRNFQSLYKIFIYIPCLPLASPCTTLQPPAPQEPPPPEPVLPSLKEKVPPGKPAPADIRGSGARSCSPLTNST